MPDWLEILLTVLLLLVMLAGLLGLIIPAFPGLTVIWLAALGFGVIHGFSTLGIVLFVLLTLLMIGGNVVDNLLMGAGALQRRRRLGLGNCLAGGGDHLYPDLSTFWRVDCRPAVGLPAGALPRT